MGADERNGLTDNLGVEAHEQKTNASGLVAVGGKLPHCFLVSTSKLLDVMIALQELRGPGLDAEQKKRLRQTLNQKLYNKTRPGFYLEFDERFHIGYAGQPYGAKTQHHWRIFCAEQLKAQVETVIAKTTLVISGHQSQNQKANGNYSIEWGGLYLRSKAELRIAEELDRTGLLFFANARGRVGLNNNTIISNDQLTGRVEVDFMVICQGRCMILEVDGQHHLEDGQIVRDYARDRVLLRSGVPTVRFTAQDCLNRPDEVVSEFLSILMNAAPDSSYISESAVQVSPVK